MTNWSHVSSETLNTFQSKKHQWVVVVVIVVGVAPLPFLVAGKKDMSVLLRGASPPTPSNFSAPCQQCLPHPTYTVN